MYFNKNDFFVWNTASLDVYLQTVYVYARSVRYAVDLLCSPPAVICLMGRAADNLIKIQAVVKKRRSKFKLLGCCRIFLHRSDRLCPLQGAAQIQEVVGPLTAIERTLVLYYSIDYLCFRFLYKRLPLLVLV